MVRGVTRIGSGVLVVLASSLVSMSTAGAEPTIQSLIDAAAPGSVVVIGPGEYHEHINFHGKAITLRSQFGPGSTILDGDGAPSPVVAFHSGETRSSVLEGFTIQHGQNGIDIAGASETSPIVRSNVIRWNVGAEGGGVRIATAGHPLLIDNVITENSRNPALFPGRGGGVYIAGFGAAEIVGNTIVNNSTDEAAGIFMNAAGTPVLRDNVIVNNHASFRIGGVESVNFSNVDVVQNLIALNDGPAPQLSFSVPIDTRGPLFVNNTMVGTDTVVEISNGSLVRFYNNILKTRSTGRSAVICSGPPARWVQNIVRGPDGVGPCASDTSYGTMNINPKFLNPSFGDRRLASDSPAIDRGRTSAPAVPDIAIDGQPRVVDGDGDGVARVDLGAFEYQP